MKMKSSIKRRCMFCKIIKRSKKLYIICKKKKHKQKQI